MTPGFLSSGDFDDRFCWFAKKNVFFPPTHQAFPLLKTFLVLFSLSPKENSLLSRFSHGDCTEFTCVGVSTGCSFDPLPRRIGQSESFSLSR